MRTRAPSTLSSIEREAAALPFNRGRLFRLSKERIPASYLFGTLHTSGAEAGQLPEGVRQALAGARAVAVETTEVGSLRDPDAVRKLQPTLTALPAQRAERLLNAQEFARLRTLIVRGGIPESAARKLKPAVLALALDVPPCSRAEAATPSYPDAMVLTTAREKGIPVLGLETLAEHITTLDGLPPDDERKLLRAIVRHADRAEDIIATSLARYKEGNGGLLLAWMRSPDPLIGIAGAQTPPAFLDRLLDARNRRMRDRMLPLLRAGNAFIAIGIAHIPGRNGLAHLLEREGYRVELVD